METQTLSSSGYAPVNGLQMHYELHNEGGAGTPLVLIHGAISGIGTSFGQLLPGLAGGRPVTGVELQGHAPKCRRPASRVGVASRSCPSRSPSPGGQLK